MTVFFKLFLVPPRIQSTEVHYTVNENSQAILPCVADGIPTPSINWKKDNVLLANLLGKYTVEPYGELILENVVVSLIDMSRYTHLDFFFLFPAAPSAYGSSRPGVKSELHLQPIPQPRQQWI